MGASFPKPLALASSMFPLGDFLSAATGGMGAVMSGRGRVVIFLGLGGRLSTVRL